MNANRFQSILILIVPQVAQLIVEKLLASDAEATQMLYSSKLYAALEDETTKLWHLSALTLYNMFEEEQKTGILTFPEEA